jgi:1-pyrroline-5-carboxylate dehydrogenase
MTKEMSFKLTYSTMFNPPEELHDRFDADVVRTKANLGKEYGMIIGGRERHAARKFEDRCPADTDVVLGLFQKGTAQDADDAVSAAEKAFPAWSRTPWHERVGLLRKAATLIGERIFAMSAALAMEVGKNRMEALGEVAETVDLLRYACDSMEKNNGFVVEMGRDPLVGFRSTNVSVLRPYGVWLVINPFNFPCALSGGPAAAALVAGNTLVMKPASDSPWSVHLIAACLRDAGVPEGVFNYVTGPGSVVGQALLDNPRVSGITFTGSFEVGMQIYRAYAGGRWIRPAILEMGGKNAAIVSRHADLDDAAVGIGRSAFGLQGQKCSACSRVFVEESAYDLLVEKLMARTAEMTIGDPTERDVYLGPVINKNSYREYQAYAEELGRCATIFTGGKVLTEGGLARGYFVAPTLAVDLAADHRLWQQEMFVPITIVAKVKDLEEAIRRANEVTYGLTAGFYGAPDEVEWFFDRIEAGVAYANRPQGATTGAWPGYQPFGGWKGSGATGKNAGGLYYLPLYLREQIRTLVARA